jgi:DNA invertase Pin-like site-specific DNA recombinase
VVWRLDRLGRSLRHLIETVGELEAQGVGFPQLARVGRHGRARLAGLSSTCSALLLSLSVT